jgi:two-component system, chemotaxis family, chemotaxis protein CheY
MKILIVDDSKLSRSFVKKILQEKDHTFFEARDGSEAIDLYSKNSPDMVLLDLTMPGIKGLDVLTKMVQINDKAQIVIATADVQDLTRREAKKLGAAGYITKPFQAEELRQIVEKFGEKS